MSLFYSEDGHLKFILLIHFIKHHLSNLLKTEYDLVIFMPTLYVLRQEPVCLLDKMLQRQNNQLDQT